MPMKSKAQNRAMHAAAASRKAAEKIGIPQKVAKKFVAEAQGQSVKRLPEKVKTKGKV